MFEVKSDIHGRRIAVRAEHSRGYLAAFPAVRVVREQDGVPGKAASALVVFDVHRQFGDPAAPSASARRVRALTANAVRDGGLPEFELWEASHPPNPVDPDEPVVTPKFVYVDFWDSAAGLLKEHRFIDLTASETVVEQAAPWTKTTTSYLQGADVVATVEYWAAPGQPPHIVYSSIYNAPITVHYDIHEVWSARHTFTREAGSPDFTADFVWTRGDEVLLSGALRNLLHPAQGSWWTALELADEVPSDAGAPPGLDPQTYYYYALLIETPGPDGPEFDAAPVARGAAMATGRYDEDERLYQRLPAIHRYYDEPEPALYGNGQLRRFLRVFGGALDHARGFADGLRIRNDVLNVDRASLPHLARWVGWDVDRTNPGEIQRNDVLLATDIFERVGTERALRALISRATSWQFQIREFHRNVASTNERPVGYWDLWRGISGNGTTFTASIGLDNPDPARLAGGSALVVGSGDVWEFWHQSTTGRRELWVRWPALGFSPVRVAVDALNDPRSVDESPAAVLDGDTLRLFWSSDRDGGPSIWSRTVSQFQQNGQLGPVGAPERLTTAAGEDRNPAAVVQPHDPPNPALDRLWLFWESNRRGPTDVWSRTRVGGVWSEPRRVTTADIADRSPSAVLDADGAVRLFWSSTTETGCRLFTSVQTATALGDEWDPPQQVTHVDDPVGHYRDEAPCAILFQGKIRLYWHSNRAGAWQIWTRELTGNSWGPATQVTEFVGMTSTRMVGAKEPAAVVANNIIYAAWRAQRRGESYVSRTMFATDPDARAAMDQIGDWNHYTFDGGRALGDWYAHDTVGVYLTPPPPEEDDQDYEKTVAAEMELIRNFVEPYRPATVRIVWFDGMTPKL